MRMTLEMRFNCPIGVFPVGQAQAALKIARKVSSCALGRACLARGKGHRQKELGFILFGQFLSYSCMEKFEFQENILIITRVHILFSDVSQTSSGERGIW